MCRVPRVVLVLSLLSAPAFLVAAPALGSDLADEADLHFRLGAERYTAGDFNSALEHFLASNRLAQNRNAVFNVARTYEKLGRFPEAFRYYTSALAAETDAAARVPIERAIEQIRPRVAVLDIITQPPGATLYVDRKDLGARGESPRLLGVAPGKYTVIAELPGYHPARVVVPEVALGSTVPITLVLPPILGTLRVEGDARGARIRVDGEGEGEPPRCLVPCTLKLPPGRHTLHLSLLGHAPSELAVEVSANSVSVVRPSLEPITGTLLVSTDEPGAVVEVDGRARGFTPVVLPLPVGRHELRVSREGYRDVRRAVEVSAERQVKVALELTPEEEVEAVSRATESVDDAPSSVSIVPRAELLAFGYPTVAEALRGTRGVYLWNDRSYVSVGMRGIGRLGSYSNRELVLVDGHPANDNWIGSAYLGFDGRTDLGDVERIEVVRGPGSVLYGTNAFSGVVNVVTRDVSPRRARGEVGLSAVDAGVGRGRVRVEARLGDKGEIWASLSGARGGGRDFFFPELATTTPTGGHSRGADGLTAGTVQARARYDFVTVQGFLHSHEKHLPTGAFETLLDDPRSQQTDTRGFVEARVEPELSKSVQLLSRIHANHYRFRGNYARPPADAGLERDSYDGSWFGVEQRVVVTPGEALRLTLGGEGQLHFQVDARGEDDEGVFLDETGGNGRNFRVGAVYGVADAALTDRLRVSAGARVDAYSTFGTSLNPRGAIIIRPYEQGNLKLLGGKAFRAPSIYELYYNDGFTQEASPGLDPESVYSFEIEHSHRFSPTWVGIASVFTSYLKDLIVARGAGTEIDRLHYVNSSSPLLSYGAELGVRREWRQGFMLAASAGYVRTGFLASTSASDLLSVREDPGARRVANAPELMASLKAAAPLFARGLTAASRLTVESARYDRYELDADPQQGTSGASFLWDVILSGLEERWDLRYSFGVYNVTDARYSLPVSNELTQTTIRQDGRTLLVSADLAF